MATITVRDLDESTRANLRIRAARNGRSMEAEVREILNAAVTTEPSHGVGLGSRLRTVFADLGGGDDLFALSEPRELIQPESPAYAGLEEGDPRK